MSTIEAATELVATKISSEFLSASIDHDRARFE